MKYGHILLLFLAIIPQLVVADITDILFNREATYEERQSVAKQLSTNSKQDRPLTVRDAIAEVCYGIDLCAGLTEESELEKNCNYQYSESGDQEPISSDGCYAKYFRKQYQCAPNVTKQSSQAVYVMMSILVDYQTTYSSMVMSDMISYLNRSYNIDIGVLLKNPILFDQYMKDHPLFAKKMATMSRDAAALGQYTLDCYEKMNPMLYKKDQKQITRYYNLFRATINTMAITPSFKGMVNRGAQLPVNVLKEHHKVGNIVCYDGFTSTAVHDEETDRGDNPANNFLAEKCGQRLYMNYEENGAIPGKLIDNVSASKGENEVLFEPGACFRIDKVYPRTDSAGLEDSNMKCAEGQRYNFEMTLIPSK